MLGEENGDERLLYELCWKTVFGGMDGVENLECGCSKRVNFHFFFFSKIFYRRKYFVSFRVVIL